MKRPAHVMIDLETLSFDANGLIVSIGAVAFDADVIHDVFYAVLDRQAQIDKGAVVSPATVDWWLEQAPAARAVFKEPQSNVALKLGEFAGWLMRYEVLGVWGNGAEMDNAMLAQTYRRHGLPVPWKHTASRCYRTAKNLNLDCALPAFDGTPHDALDDARHQAACLMHINKAAGGIIL